MQRNGPKKKRDKTNRRKKTPGKKICFFLISFGQFCFDMAYGISERLSPRSKDQGELSGKEQWSSQGRRISANGLNAARSWPAETRLLHCSFPLAPGGVFGI
jgi:hypothetical protein